VGGRGNKWRGVVDGGGRGNKWRGVVAAGRCWGGEYVFIHSLT